jgi:hypothetical protein
MSTLQLSNLRRKTAYYQHDAPDWVRNVWNRPESFDWFIKNNRAELCIAGALVKLGRDFFVDTTAFPGAAERILGLTHAEENPSILSGRYGEA